MFRGGFFLCLAAFEIVAGAGIRAQAADHDDRQGGVGSPVTAAIETVALGFAGGCLDGADAAERGEGCFAAEPFGVVAGGDDQGGGAVGTDADRRSWPAQAVRAAVMRCWRSLPRR